MKHAGRRSVCRRASSLLLGIVGLFSLSLGLGSATGRPSSSSFLPSTTASYFSSSKSVDLWKPGLTALRRVEAVTEAPQATDSASAEAQQKESDEPGAWSSWSEVWQSIRYLLGFFIVSIAAYPLGLLFPTYLKLPLITGYLIVGILAGPYVSALLSDDLISRLQKLVTSLALSFISFQAGYEVFFPVLRGQLRDILVILAGIYVATMLLMTVTLYLAADPFFYGDLSSSCQLAISLMFSSIAVLGSPATALALHVEFRTKGPFTNLMLGVTSIAELLVLLSFSVSRILSTIYCSTLELGGEHVAFGLGIVFSNLLVGLILGTVVAFILWCPLGEFEVRRRRWALFLRGTLWMGVGFGFFIGSDYIAEGSHSAWGPYWHIKFEPLLVCMVAACAAGHITSLRGKMHDILDAAAMLMYLPFFTMTGAALNLSAVVKAIPLMSVFIGVRFVSIFLGAYISCRFLLSLPPVMYNNLWLCFTPQAGVALGLAQEVLSISSDTWVSEFSATIISAVVINQMIGPILSSIGVKNSGEATVDITVTGRERASSVSSKSLPLRRGRSLGRGRSVHGMRLVDNVAILGKGRFSFSLALHMSSLGIHVRVPVLPATAEEGTIAEEDETVMDTAMKAHGEGANPFEFEFVDEVIAPDILKRKPAEPDTEGQKPEEKREDERTTDTSSTGEGQEPAPACELDKAKLLSHIDVGVKESRSGQDSGRQKTYAIDQLTDVVVVCFDDDTERTTRCCKHLVDSIQLPRRIIAVVEDANVATELDQLGVLVVQPEVTLSHVVTNIALAEDDDAVYLSRLAWDDPRAEVEVIEGEREEEEDFRVFRSKRHYSRNIINFHRIDFSHAATYVADIFAHRVAHEDDANEEVYPNKLPRPHDFDPDLYVIHFSPRSSPRISPRMQRALSTDSRRSSRASARQRVLSRRTSMTRDF